MLNWAEHGSVRMYAAFVCFKSCVTSGITEVKMTKFGRNDEVSTTVFKIKSTRCLSLTLKLNDNSQERF